MKPVENYRSRMPFETIGHSPRHLAIATPVPASIGAQAFLPWMPRLGFAFIPILSRARTLAAMAMSFAVSRRIRPTWVKGLLLVPLLNKPAIAVDGAPTHEIPTNCTNSKLRAASDHEGVKNTCPWGCMRIEMHERRAAVPLG